MVYKYTVDQVIRENFDFSDKTTRKYLLSLDEEDKSAVATALAAALYDKIVKRVDNIDFGSIPKSNGDITKVDGYANTVECLDIIKKLVTEYKESTETVDVVINAIENIKGRKPMFMKAFATKTELPMTTYNLMVLSIEHSVSFLISVCIEYIKNRETNTIELALSKAAYNNAHDNLLFQQLADFNKSCGSGELDACFAEVLNGKTVKEDADIVVAPGYVSTKADNPGIVDKTDNDSGLFSGEFDYNEPAQIEPIIPESDEADVETDDVDYEFNDTNVKPAFEEPVVTNEIGITGIAGATAVIIFGGKYILRGAVYLVKVLIPKLRSISYFFIHSRVKLSDNLAIQAQLLEMNAYALQYDDNSNINEEKRKKIAAKQLKIADNLKKWSNKFAIDNKTAEKKTAESEKEENKNTTDEDGNILF